MSEHQSLTKESVRELIRTKRKNLSKLTLQLAAASCADNIIDSKILINKSKIAFYLAQDNELDLNILITYCFNHNQDNSKKFYLPALASTNQAAKHHLLHFIEYTKTTKLQNNKYNIPEPIATNQDSHIKPENLDLVFVPVVAFTKLGERLGMGGGYYDRTFAFLANSANNILTKPILIGIAYDFQCIDYLPNNCWDINLYGIATESRFYKF